MTKLFKALSAVILALATGLTYYLGQLGVDVRLMAIFLAIGWMAFFSGVLIDWEGEE